MKVSDDLSPDKKGIIRLWWPKKYIGGKWSVEGDNESNTQQYFFIPYGFYHSNGDKFKFSWPYKFVKKKLKVNTKVTVNGSLVVAGESATGGPVVGVATGTLTGKGVGETEDVWTFEPVEDKETNLQTDEKTKLPFLEIPKIDDGDFKINKERRYFIPILGGGR